MFKEKCVDSLKRYYKEVIILKQDTANIKEEPDEKFLDTSEFAFENVCEIIKNEVSSDNEDDIIVRKLVKVRRNSKKYLNFLKKYECEYCQKVFKLSRQLKLHQKTHKAPGDGQFTCFFCEKSFSSKLSITNHMKSHMKLPKKIDKSKNDLKEQTSIETTSSSKSQKVCDICGKKLFDTRSLRRHKESHNKEKNIKCPNCDFATNTQHNLTEHIRRQHSTNHPFSCSQCGKTFPFEYMLKYHMTVHSKDRSYQCSVCGKTFKGPSDLRSHQDSHNLHRPFICHCGMGFKSKGALKKHSRIHTETRQSFTCEFCNKTYVSYEGLKTHKLMHHSSERPFACSKCDLRFAYKTALKMHQKVHDDKRDQICNICGANFKHQASLWNHMKAHKKQNQTT